MAAEQLILNDQPREYGMRRAVDVFFRTLANTHGSLSTAIVLSGGNGDGVIGDMRIKESGELTVAQDPGEAQFQAQSQRTASLRSLSANSLRPISFARNSRINSRCEGVIHVCGGFKLVRLQNQIEPPCVPSRGGLGATGSRYAAAIACKSGQKPKPLKHAVDGVARKSMRISLEALVERVGFFLPREAASRRF
jgi:hypothetical protein